MAQRKTSPSATVTLVIPPLSAEDVPKVDDNDYRTRLRNWNIAVAIVQTVSFIALLVLSLVYSDKAREVSIWIDTGRGTIIQQLASYRLYVTLLPFPIITAAFHVLALLMKDKYYDDVLVRGQNLLRWIEYMITNGLMTFSLCTLVGAGGVVLLVVNLIGNIIMQSFGYLHESRVHGRGKRTLAYIGFGFLPWLQNWVTIFTYYGLNIGSLRISEHLAVVGSFLLSLTFVYPLLAIYWQPHTTKNFFTLERTYIILSLTAKLYLDWILVSGTIANF